VRWGGGGTGGMHTRLQDKEMACQPAIAGSWKPSWQQGCEAASTGPAGCMFYAVCPTHCDLAQVHVAPCLTPLPPPPWSHSPASCTTTR
jgi:hypothetical protein